MSAHALRLSCLDPAVLFRGHGDRLVCWPRAGSAAAVLQDDPEDCGGAQRVALWVRSDAGVSSGVRVSLQAGWVLSAQGGGPKIALSRLVVFSGAAAGVYALVDHPPVAGQLYKVTRRAEGTRPAERPSLPKDATSALRDAGRKPGTPQATAVCFAAGTRIATAGGALPVERLLPGTRVITRDNGLQPIRWVSSQSLVDAAIHLSGPASHAPLIVSPEHRVLLSGAEARARFGQSEVLVPARSLVGRVGVAALPARPVTYVHFALDRHEIVYAEGQPAESFRPERPALHSLPDAAREALFEVAPALRSDPGGYGPAARLCVTLGAMPAAA